MKTCNPWKLSTLLLGIALAVAVIAEPEQKGADLLHPEMRAKLLRFYPEYRITSVQPVNEFGEEIFRIRVKGESETENVLAKMSRDGELLELDEDMDLREIPPHVKKTFRKAFPEAEVLHLEKGTRMEISYRLDIRQNGRKQEVKISRRGRIFEVANPN